MNTCPRIMQTEVGSFSVRPAVSLAFCVSMFVVCFGSPAVVAQQLPPIVPASPPNDITGEAMISDIEQIRKQIGGGVAESLSGIIPTEDSNQEFAKELRKQHSLRTQDPRRSEPRQREQPTKRLYHPTEAPVVSHAVPGGGAVWQSLVEQSPGRQSPVKQSPSAQWKQQIQLTRHAARHLEELAAEFEETGVYDSADELRAQAAKFWQKARALGPKSIQRSKTTLQMPVASGALVEPSRIGERGANSSRFGASHGRE